MRAAERIGKSLVVVGSFAIASYFALQFKTDHLWKGVEPAMAEVPYDLTRLDAVNRTLKLIRDKYVDPDRIKPKEMLLSALNYVQRDVAQVIVLPNETNTEVTIRIETNEKNFRVDDIIGPWDVSAKLREVFSFLQKHLHEPDVNLKEVEYAACNGMLHTLDPHSVFMSPDQYKDMNATTTGAFGGLGISISIRDQMLTVMNPMPETPASRAGWKRLDRIVKINNESTLNMPLDDAVRRLRGEPGTKVTVWTIREGDGGWTNPKPFEMTREIVKVQSVQSKALDGGVGYIRLKQFQSTSAAEVDVALDELRGKGGLNGLVLDLRGNPGGLLDQAARIADRFLNDGIIVATVGASEGREEKRAKGPGTEPAYPMVVLTDGGSASASEIVAGALKNLDRAIIVGNQTFGKGSVQLVFPEVTSEKAALKLTIAQYLTPGDISIQEVGVTPDIALDPMTVDDLEMDLSVQRDGLRERDLSSHLSNARAIGSTKPSETVRYQLTSSQRENLREHGGELDEDFVMDFPIRFAHDLIQKMPTQNKRPDQLRAVTGFIEQVRKDELNKVTSELSKMGIDWVEPPHDASTDIKPEFETRVETDKTNHTVTAGDSMLLKVTIKNTGKLPVYRLRGITESDSSYFDNKELAFGKILPGQSKTATVPLGWCDIEGRKVGSTKPLAKNAKRICKIPMDSLSRSDGVKIRFESAGGGEPLPAEFRPTIQALERPVFQYAYQISDAEGGNGDGILQKGEHANMFLTIKNVGKGRSFETQANIANLSGDGLLLRAGRFDISNMMPEETRRVTFSFDVQSQLTEPEAALTLSVGDRDLREFATEKVRFPVRAGKQIVPTRETARVKNTNGTNLFSFADPSAPVFGKLQPNQSLEILGTSDSFRKVNLGSGRFGFVSSGDVSQENTSHNTTFEDVFSHAPPILDVTVPSFTTISDKIKINGMASANDKLMDVYIFVGDRKLYYQPNRSNNPKQASFEYDAPLHPGINVITVVARQTADNTSRRTVIVRRDGADGALLKTPKNGDDDWFTEPNPE